MRGHLDEMLFKLLEAHPEGRSLLSPDQIQMIERRESGATFKTLAVEFHLTEAGVRFKLYGTGCGTRRGGGALGKLRGLARAKRMCQQSA